MEENLTRDFPVCRVCGYKGAFGLIESRHMNGYGSLIGVMPNHKNVGAVAIRVCPECGILTSTMRGNIGGFKQS